jgi:NADH dehydrogenase
MGTITVFGGTGFLGRRIVERLASGGMHVRIAVRHPEDAERETVEAVRADLREPATIAPALEGASGAVNAVSAYVEKGGVTYPAVHEDGARNLAAACAQLKLAALVHLSGIGADPRSASRYIRARGRGELLVREAFPDATILRPSVMFGPDDAFVNTLADIARRAPVFAVMGEATRLQPVHVEDVAQAAVRALAEPSARGRIFELGGPDVLTLREIVHRVMARLGVHRPTLPVPLPLARLGARLLGLLPNPPVTLAQVELLEHDNVANATLPGLTDLGIEPRRIDVSIAALSARSSS